MILKSVLLSVLLAVIVTAPWAVASSSQARAAVQPHICLDAGHGGREPGAVKDLGDGELLREADINLDIALYLEQEWDGLYQVTMTRSTDDTLSTRQRYEACNASGADILVSVHMNSVADTAVDGSLAIYFQNDDRVLAEALYESMWAELQPTAPEPNTFRDF